MRRLATVAGAGLAAVLIAVMLSNAGTAQAFTAAFFPTQNVGNKGSDVTAIQYLLQQTGRNVAADGDFGPATDAAVKSFQSSTGLGADGIVGPLTWGALTPTLRQGSTGAAVKALQIQLNAKRSAGLAVDGVFGGGTRGAVVAFQQHAGISADGAVGPTTWKNLIWHYQYLFNGSGFCDQDPDGNGPANWGTGAAIGQLEAGVRLFGTAHGRVPFGDIGFEHGGTIPGHASHAVGLDADVWPIRTDNAQCTAGRITWQSSTYDRNATRALIKAIRAAAPGHVKLVFFNDPVLISEGLTTHLDNHDNHFHVRFCERVHPNSLYDC